VTEGFDRIMATSNANANAESRGDNVSNGKDVEAGSVNNDVETCGSANNEVETRVFCDIHGRTCENYTAHEMAPSSGDIDEWV
jgi:hypothetical protein